MKRNLLSFIFFLSAFVYGYGQLNQPLDINQCNLEVFDLTAQIPIVTSNLEPDSYTVEFYTTYGAAQSGAGSIDNPSEFVGSQQQQIFMRVTFLPGMEFQILSFYVRWGSSPVIYLQPGSMEVCLGSYLSLTVTAGGSNLSYQWYKDGVILNPGDDYSGIYDSTLLLDITPEAAGSYYCAVNSTGWCPPAITEPVTVSILPAVVARPDIILCGPYTLPAVSYGNYYTAPDGDGLEMPAGTVISANQTIYVYAPPAGPCLNEDVFQVTILPDSFETVIVTPAASTLCEGDSVLLVSEIEGVVFERRWYKNGILIPNATAPVYEAAPTETSTYTCEILNACGTHTSNDVIVTVHPFTPVDLQVFGDTCVGGDFIVGAAITSQMVSYQWYHNDVMLPPGNVVSVNNATAEDTGLYYFMVELACGTATGNEFYIEVAPECTSNTISGTIRLDEDSNGCSETDPVAANVQVQNIQGNTIQYAYTNSIGQYTFSNVQQGAHNVGVPTPPVNYSVSWPEPPSAHSFTVIGTTNAFIGDFCLLPTAELVDVSGYMMAIGNAQPGFAANYAIIVYNNGSISASGTVTLTYDASMLDYVTSPDVSSQDGNVLSFNFADISTFQYAMLNVSFVVKTPPTVDLGDVLNFAVNIATATTDTNPSDNSLTYFQTVVNSLDPNDIAVKQGETIQPDQIDEYLDYTVRFQNIGNANAVFVRIENQLDPKLDWSTFSPVASSHTFTTERTGGLVTFRFDNINLPGSQVDEEGSNGFVIYRIKPIATLAIGDVISNNANIYFDFNAPIATNTVTTELAVLATDMFDISSFVVFPNPASDKLSLRLEQQVQTAQISITDLQGKIMYNAKTGSQAQSDIDVSSFASGMYLIKVATEGFVTTKKFIVK